GREHRPDAAEDHDAHLVVGFGAQKGLVELDEHSPVLRVPRFDPVEHDPYDPRVVLDGVVEDVLVVGHGPLLGCYRSGDTDVSSGRRDKGEPCTSTTWCS